jgi:hypothetical protein
MNFRVSHPCKPVEAARPGRDVLVALAIKAVLLSGIYLLFFAPAHRPPSDAGATAEALIGSTHSKDMP